MKSGRGSRSSFPRDDATAARTPEKAGAVGLSMAENPTRQRLVRLAREGSYSQVGLLERQSLEIPLHALVGRLR
ncbi:MAG: hypothetical protein NTV92_00460 [Candidatus Bipolaricaulota bacterium]|nr:hypothetical protein [Candidatus Bipolaricaulota bacterium]